MHRMPDIGRQPPRELQSISDTRCLIGCPVPARHNRRWPALRANVTNSPRTMPQTAHNRPSCTLLQAHCCTGPENQRWSVRRSLPSLAAPCHIGLTPVLSRPSSPYDTSGRRESRNVACEYVTSQMYNECVCMSAIGREFSKAVHQSAWDREVGWIGSRAVESKQAGSTITQQIGHKLEASNFETRTGKDR